MTNLKMGMTKLDEGTSSLIKMTSDLVMSEEEIIENPKQITYRSAGKYCISYFDFDTMKLWLAVGNPTVGWKNTIVDKNECVRWSNICLRENNLLAISYVKPKEDNDYRLHCAVENDDGTWEKITLANNIMSENHSIACDSHGRLYIAFWAHTSFDSSSTVSLKCAKRHLSGLWTIEDIDVNPQILYWGPNISRPEMKISPDSDIPYVVYQYIEHIGEGVFTYTPKIAKRLGKENWVSSSISSALATNYDGTTFQCGQNFIINSESNIIYYFIYYNDSDDCVYKKATFDGSTWTIVDTAYDWTGYGYIDINFGLDSNENVLVDTQDGTDSNALHILVNGVEIAVDVAQTDLTYYPRTAGIINNNSVITNFDGTNYNLVFYEGDTSTTHTIKANVFAIDMGMTVTI